MKRTLLSYMTDDIIRFFDKVSKIMRDEPAEALKELRNMSSIIDEVVPFHDSHSTRVSEYSLEIGKRLGLTDREMIILEATALLHDIGLLGVNERILLKPASLTGKERKEMEKHVIRGYYLLWGFEEFEEVSKYIGCYHERYNGSGYPNCLAGRKIPVIGRILAVTEAYDAMRSPRPYRKATSKKQVKKELRKFAGKQFDPEMVIHLLEVLNSIRG